MSEQEVIVVVDSSKLWQLANFYCKVALNGHTSSPLEFVCREVLNRGWELVTTEVNFRRALADYESTLSEMDEETREALMNIVSQRLRVLIDVIKQDTTPYAESIAQAVEILQDWEEEPEDSHALALAMYFKRQGYDFIILWTGDNDFFSREDEIRSFGIELRAKLI
ncbi:PIN domain-containing protein [Desulfurobacterium sp.]